MADKSKKPEIRFEGFTETWEQRELGDHSEIVAGGTPNTGHPEYWNPKEIPWMSSGEINNKVISSTDNMISKIGFLNSSAKWVKEKSVLIALAGQGKTRGTVAISEIPLTTNQSIAAIQPDSFLYYKFLFQNLEGRYNELREVSSGDGTRGGLNKQIISDLEVLAPEIQEQIKIGDFLCGIDNLITLHQRKYEKLIQIKKSMLEKMFPKNGEKTPEIRFAGFTDDWEQRKLNEIVKSIDTGKSKFHSDSNNGEYAILGSTSIIGYDDCYDYDGDFILTARVGANAGSLYRYTGKAKISDNTVFIQAEKNIDFVYYMLTKFDIKQLSFGTGQPLVKASELKNLDLKMPTQIVEQQKIGVFFSNLDNLITLHQRKYEKLIQIKKSMLEKMFV